MSAVAATDDAGEAGPTGPLSTAAKIAVAADYKDKGNAFFRAGELKKAIRQYRTAFLYSKGLVAINDQSMGAYAQPEAKLTQEQTDTVNELNRSCYSNLAACYLKLNTFDKALVAADAALAIKADDVKSLVRKGQACMALKDWKRAKDALVAANEAEPGNAAVVGALKEWKAGYAKWAEEQKQKEMAVYGGKLL